jgi:predicted nucleic acid-binding protein
LSRVALDTNILVYAQGLGDADRVATARSLIDRLPPGALVVPVQALGELFRVLVGKGGLAPVRAADAVNHWRGGASIQDTTNSVMEQAVDIACVHGFQIWDAIMLAAAESAGCRLLLSEDMHDGFAWRGVTVLNPFAPGGLPTLLVRVFAGGTP